METIHQELIVPFEDSAHVIRVVIRLFLAALVGGLIGWERLRDGKAAGLRTHMLVAVGAALFTLAPLELKMQPADLSRVIQGVAAGIGFLGAGTILKLSDQHKIEGLTSAASIWLTAAAGMAVGAGRPWPSMMAVALAWLILYGLHRVEDHVHAKHAARREEDKK